MDLYLSQVHYAPRCAGAPPCFACPRRLPRAAPPQPHCQNGTEPCLRALCGPSAAHVGASLLAPPPTLTLLMYQRSRWGYDDLVEAHLAGILASASSLDSGDEGGASEASGVRGGGEG